MKLLVFSMLLGFSLACQATSKAQTVSPCKLPEVRGLAVGMTVDDIRKRFKYFKTPEADAYGYAEFNDNLLLEKGRYESLSEGRVIDPLEGFDTSGLAGVDIAFLDNKVVTLVVSYKGSVEWSGVDEFVKVWSTSLKLPGPTEWVKVSPATLQLNCGTGAIRASTEYPRGSGVGSSVAIGETGIKAEILKRRQDEKDRARKTFKP